MPTLRLAHRGDWRRAPGEHDRAFLAALAVPGCDGLEFDVRARDGVPVLSTTRRSTRVQGVDPRVDDADRRRARGAGVPTLDEVLAAIPRRAFLDVELKGDPAGGASTS